MGILDVFSLSGETKDKAKQAFQLAGERRLNEALTLAHEALRFWEPDPGWLERQARRLALGDLLVKLTQEQETWQRKVDEARALSQRGANWLAELDRQPHDVSIARQAIEAYEQALALLVDDELRAAVGTARMRAATQRQFLDLITAAERQEAERFYRLAHESYSQASSLFPAASLASHIEACLSKLPDEDAYVASFQRAQALEAEGHPARAMHILEGALASFPRADGKECLARLRPQVEAQTHYLKGLEAESAGELLVAAQCYEAAVHAVPNAASPRLRIGVLAIKSGAWEVAERSVAGLEADQAAYIRGFSAAQRGDYAQANREWRNLHSPSVEAQVELLKVLSERDRTQRRQAIEQLVVAGDFKAAAHASEDYIRTYGADAWVEQNLQGHIRPRLEADTWESRPWRLVLEATEGSWKENPSPPTLHNWAVAAHYAAQDDIEFLPALIAAWSTAIANLALDPALSELPWRKGEPLDHAALEATLFTLLEEAVDSHKGGNIELYFMLRDKLRVERAWLKLMNKATSRGAKLQSLWIGPAARARLSSPEAAPLKQVLNADRDTLLLHGLYTAWGTAIAACQEGDIDRAISLYGPLKAQTETERFAQRWVAYHIGCHHLRRSQWREAKAPLQMAKQDILAVPAWRDEVDQLCAQQRQALSGLSEHLTFAQAWFDLLGSQQARASLAEFKTEEVREKLAKDSITPDAAIRELEAIKHIDARNPVLLELIEMVETHREMKRIATLIDRGQFQEAVAAAKRSSNERVRSTVAEMCIEVLINSLERRSLHPHAMIQLADWACELCPTNPDYRDIRRRLRY